MSLPVAGCYDAAEVNAFLLKPRAPVCATEYRMLPPDVISVSSTQVPEINGFTSQIRPDGKVNVPLIGEIFVAEKSPKQVEETIKAAAKKYYAEVDATVQVVGYNSRKFYVFGEVAKPGPVRWTGCDTVLDVLASAQPTALAWPERIVVIRAPEPSQGGYANQTSLGYKVFGLNDSPDGKGARGGSGMADGVVVVGGNQAATQPATMPVRDAPEPGTGPQRITINLVAMVQFGDMANNILLKPNDVVYVQPNPFAQFARGVDTLCTPFRAMSNGLDDYRRTVTDLRWLRDGMPSEGNNNTATFIAR
jgi:protein involved in polysaccharide export with SLBB domain